MSQNTPTPSDEDLFWPNIVQLWAHPDTTVRIDQQLFPLGKSLIDDMPEYLDIVNTIIKNWWLQEITTQELSLIQAFIRGNNTPDEIIQIEKQYNTNMVLWLRFYLEYRNKDQRMSEYQGFINWPTEATEGFSEKAKERMMEKLRKKIKTHDTVKEILKNIK